MYTFSYKLKAGLIVGTLDISAAFLYFYIKTGKSPLRVLTYIASGIFGKTAYEGGTEMLFFGLILHYLIATTFAFLFFWIFSRIDVIRKLGLLAGVLYGVIVWLIMNLVVVPFSSVTKPPFRWDGALINMLILIVCIGIPLFIMARAHYKKRVVLLHA